MAESSFIQSFSAGALGQLAEAIGGRATVTVVDFGPLADAIGRLHLTTMRLLDAVENPRRTAAEELYRDGVMALGHGWHSDALRDLEASVRSRPYSSASHLWLGIGHLRAGNHRLWIEEMELAVKYAEAGGRDAGVTAAIIAAHAYDSVDRRDLALKVLHSALRLGPCVAVAQAILMRDPADLAVQRLYVGWILATRGAVPEPGRSWYRRFAGAERTHIFTMCFQVCSMMRVTPLGNSRRLSCQLI
ncbi:MAG: hypothetical protein ACRDNF_13445 [Streptosporangiaceae bacterium]